MSYIKKELLLADILDAKIKNTREDSRAVLNIFEHMVEKQPNIDVVEVRYGKWIHEQPYIAPNGKYLKASECSNCHAVFVSNGNEPYSDHPYCCECGAKMDGERKAKA